jgi:membrane protein DedA with SNARE-associated domain
VSYLAALLIPLPSNTTLLAAAAFASQGYLNIYLVLFVAFLANVLGDITGFIVSDRYGESFLIKIGLRKVIASEEYKKTEKFIVSNSRTTIFVTRFFGGVGPIVNILSGLSKDISFKKFLTYGIPGELVYVLSLGLAGYFLGDTWQSLLLSAEDATIAVVGIIVIFFIGKYYYNRLKG